MKPRYRIKFYMSSVAGRWFSKCFFVRDDKEIQIGGPTPYGIIGRNNSIIWEVDPYIQAVNSLDIHIFPRRYGNN